jgi:hypothetical protein
LQRYHGLNDPDVPLRASLSGDMVEALTGFLDRAKGGGTIYAALNQARSDHGRSLAEIGRFCVWVIRTRSGLARVGASWESGSDEKSASSRSVLRLAKEPLILLPAVESTRNGPNLSGH